MRAHIQFKEIVRSPWNMIIRQFLIFALILTLAIPAIVKLLLTGPETAPWPIVFKNYLLHPPLPLLLPIWTALGIGIILINRVSITVKNNVLHLPPESRYKARRIPLSEIVICRRKEYQPSLATQLGPGNARGNYQDQTVPLPGYKGPGVQIGFRRPKTNIKNLLSLAYLDPPGKDAVTVRVHFPCKNADQLIKLIGSLK